MEFITPFAPALQQVEHAGQRKAEELGQPRRVDHLHDVDMIVQMPADTGQIVDHRDAVALQLGAGADAREHQQLR